MNSPSPNSKATSINSAQYRLRRATLKDVDALKCLIDASARGLSLADYSTSEVEAALLGTFGVDTQLIQDDTYWLIEDHQRIVAAGGWSYRAAICGSDTIPGRDSAVLKPDADAARISPPCATRHAAWRPLLSGARLCAGSSHRTVSHR